MQKPHQKQLWGALFHCSILFVENKRLQEAPVLLFAVFSAFFQLGAYSAANVFARFLWTPLEIIIIQKTKKIYRLKGQLKVKENYADSSFKVALALHHSQYNEVTWIWPEPQRGENTLKWRRHKLAREPWQGGLGTAVKRRHFINLAGRRRRRRSNWKAANQSNTETKCVCMRQPSAVRSTSKGK